MLRKQEREREKVLVRGGTRRRWQGNTEGGRANLGKVGTVLLPFSRTASVTRNG